MAYEGWVGRVMRVRQLPAQPVFSELFAREAYGVGAPAFSIEEPPEEERGAPPVVTQAPLDVRPGGPISRGDWDSQPSHLTLDQNGRMPDHEGAVGDDADRGGGAFPPLPFRDVADRTAAGVLTLYHGTSTPAAEQIQAEGLKGPDMGYDSPGWYMLAETFEDAALHAKDPEPTVVTFEVPIGDRKGWPGYPYLWKASPSGQGWYALRQPLPSTFVVDVYQLEHNYEQDKDAEVGADLTMLDKGEGGTALNEWADDAYSTPYGQNFTEGGGTTIHLGQAEEDVQAAVQTRVGGPVPLERGVYPVGANIFKVTDEAAEANAMATVMMNPSSLVVRVHDVFGFEVDGQVRYGILQEKLDPPRPDYAMLCEGFAGQPITPDHVEAVIAAWESGDVPYSVDVRRLPKDWKAWIRGVAQYLESVGIHFEDLHGENVMRKGDQHKLIDLGFSQAAQQPIEVIARRAQNQGRAPWAAVDLDGTLLQYESGMGAKGLFGKPMAGAAKAMRELKALGWKVSVFTARIGDGGPEETQQVANQIAEVLEGYGIPFDDVWIGRKPKADYFVDDKAIPFRGSWDEVLRELVETGQTGKGHGEDWHVSDVAGQAADVAMGRDGTTGLIDPTDDGGGNDFDDQGYTRHDISVARPPSREEMWF